MARWLWKSGQVTPQQSVVRWDLQSVNTCPENFQFKPTEILVAAPGLYEVTLAFFSKKKRPLVQVLSNSDVVVQSVNKAVCNTCGSQCQVPQANGHVQKMCNGIYKVTMIEFVVLPGKAKI